MTVIHKPGEGYNFEKATIIPTGTSIVTSDKPLNIPAVVDDTKAATVSITTPYVYTPAKKQIVDTTDLTNHGVVLFRQSDLQDIFVKSGPNAKENEFQVHYWALTLRMIGEDNSILDIAIPTCYFNYPQQVSAAHIDFEMSDVSDTSDKILPLHEHVIQNLLSTNLITQFEERLGIKVELISQHLGSIHRHPGSSSHQGFSGTDYGKNPHSHGIVYPFQTAKLDSSFAGIMAIDSGICRLAHNEYRVATGELGVDMTYVKGRCLAIVIDDLTKASAAETVLGKFITTHYTKENNSIVSTTIEQFLVNWYKEVLKHLTPNTLAINPDYVTKKAVYSYKSYVPYGTYGSYYEERTIDVTGKDPDSKDLLPFSKGITELNRMSKKEVIRWLSKIYAILGTTMDLAAIKKLKHEELVASVLERQQEYRESRKGALTKKNEMPQEEKKPIVFPTDDADIVIKFDEKYQPKEDFSVQYKREALRDHLNPYIINNASDARIEELFDQYII